MINIPDDVEKWDLGLIVNLIHEGYDENEILEFKSSINAETHRIPITACAFANTKGGFLILGVDNDRSKTLSFEQRLLGLEDSDDLKSKITNQLKTIRPDILLDYTEFRKSNIKLSNNKVLVVLRILRSNKRPHQYDNKFYKRISNGNIPMDVEEVREMILESQKNRRLLRLFLQEGGYLRDQLMTIKKDLTKDNLWLSLLASRDIGVNAIENFLFHQSYLYSIEIQDRISRIFDGVRKIMDIEPDLEALLKNPPKDMSGMEFSEKKYTKVDNYIRDILTYHVDRILYHFEPLEKLLQVEFIEPITGVDLTSEEYDKRIKEVDESDL